MKITEGDSDKGVNIYTNSELLSSGQSEEILYKGLSENLNLFYLLYSFRFFFLTLSPSLKARS